MLVFFQSDGKELEINAWLNIISKGSQIAAGFLRIETPNNFT